MSTSRGGRRRQPRGRPPLHSSQRRSLKLWTRVTPAEGSTIADRSIEAHLTVSAYLRSAALHAVLRAPSVPAVNIRYLGELGRVGNNLNQLVHALHAGRGAPGLLTILDELSSLLTTIRRELIGLQSAPDDCQGDQGNGVPRHS